MLSAFFSWHYYAFQVNMIRFAQQIQSNLNLYYLLLTKTYYVFLGQIYTLPKFLVNDKGIRNNNSEIKLVFEHIKNNI